MPNHTQGTLTVTPTTTPFQTTTPYVPQNPVGTPIHHRMQNPPYTHNQLRDKSRLGGNHHLVGLSLLGDNHPCTYPLGGNPLLLVKPQLSLKLW
jgi:hypothetical protein